LHLHTQAERERKALQAARPKVGPESLSLKVPIRAARASGTARASTNPSTTIRVSSTQPLASALPLPAMPCPPSHWDSGPTLGRAVCKPFLSLSHSTSLLNLTLTFHVRFWVKRPLPALVLTYSVMVSYLLLPMSTAADQRLSGENPQNIFGVGWDVAVQFPFISPRSPRSAPSCTLKMASISAKTNASLARAALRPRVAARK
jgi:hypothetical protein